MILKDLTLSVLVLTLSVLVLESLIIKYQTRCRDVSRATAKAAMATTNKASPPSKTPTKRAAHAAR